MLTCPRGQCRQLCLANVSQSHLAFCRCFFPSSSVSTLSNSVIALKSTLALSPPAYQHSYLSIAFFAANPLLVEGVPCRQLAAYDGLCSVEAVKQICPHEAYHWDFNWRMGRLFRIMLNGRAHTLGELEIQGAKTCRFDLIWGVIGCRFVWCHVRRGRILIGETTDCGKLGWDILEALNAEWNKMFVTRLVMWEDKILEMYPFDWSRTNAGGLPNGATQVRY